MKFKLWGIAAGLGVLGLAGAAYIYSQSEWYGFDVLMRRGGSFWVESSVDDPRLTPSMRLAMQEKVPEVKAGSIVWRELAKGFETTEVQVMAGDKVVDRILVNRIDPALYSLSVHNQTKGFRDLGQWEKALPNAALIVNGSYFSRTGTPTTPFVSEGKFIGVKPYDAKAGAFVATTDGVHVLDLSGGKGWEKAFDGAQNAMVSYPLLVGEDGQNHVSVKSNWLANRTFVAEDRQGRILIGTTEDAFFSLYRLGEFLRDAPLDIRVALNLDGGPVACQSVRVGGFERHFIAQWESTADSNRQNVKLLTWPFGSHGTWAMPVVLVATPK